MRIGFSKKFPNREKLTWIRDAGFDYVEIALKALAEATEEDYAQFREDLRAVGLPCEAANQLFPAGMTLCGHHVDLAAVENYLQGAFQRAKEVGITIAVFGSGGARKAPPETTVKLAEAQIFSLCRVAVEPLAKAYGITVVMEPLSDTNVLPTVASTAPFVEKLASPYILGLADTYHMGVNGENFGDVRLYRENAAHMHIANPEGRVWPQKTDAADYGAFFAALKDIRYTGRLTVEANAIKTAEQLPALTACAAFLREATR